MEGEAREKRSGKRLCISAESIIVVGIALRRRRCTRPTKPNIQREGDRRGTRRYRAKRLFALFGPVLARARFASSMHSLDNSLRCTRARKEKETKRNETKRRFVYGVVFMEWRRVGVVERLFMDELYSESVDHRRRRLQIIASHLRSCL